MQTPKFNKKIQNAIYLIIFFCILAIGLFFLVTKPLALSLRTTQAQFKAKEKEKLAKEQKLSDLKALKTKINEYKSKSDPLIKALPAKEDVPGILVQIEALFNDTGMPMQEFSVPTAGSAQEQTGTSTSGTIGLEGGTQTATTSDSYSVATISFSLATSGSYSQIINFLTALQDNLRIMRINEFSLAPAEEGTDFSFSCSVQMYYLTKGTTEGTTK